MIWAVCRACGTALCAVGLIGVIVFGGAAGWTGMMAILDYVERDGTRKQPKETEKCAGAPSCAPTVGAGGESRD